MHGTKQEGAADGAISTLDRGEFAWGSLCPPERFREAGLIMLYGVNWGALLLLDYARSLASNHPHEHIGYMLLSS